MLNLAFCVESMDGVDIRNRVLLARLRITSAPEGEPIHSISLRYQMHIEPARRKYSVEEKTALNDLFGSPDRWAQSVRPLPWANASVHVPAFAGATTVDVPISCSFELNFGAAKFLRSVAEGEIPLTFLFSGTVFYEQNGALQALPISWNSEAAFRLPVHTFRRSVAALGVEPESLVQDTGAAEFVQRAVERSLAADMKK